MALLAGKKFPSFQNSDDKKTKMAKIREDDLDFLSKHTASDRDQLKASFDNFIAKHPQGCITKKDFRGIMKNCFPNSNYEILEKRIFNMYDENQDGLISFRELMVVMYVMSSGTPEENLRRIYRVFDENGDGYVTKKEMKKIVMDIHGLLSEEEIPKEEVQRKKGGGSFKRSFKKKEICEAAFKEMDKDNDGKVTEEEFVKAVMGHERVSALLALKIVQVFDPDRA